MRVRSRRIREEQASGTPPLFLRRGPRLQYVGRLDVGILLDFKMGKVPALIGTGSEFSCVRSDLAEYLYLMGEPCIFTLSSVTCLLADGQRSEVRDAVKLHVKMLSFSWDNQFKVLRRGPFAVILGLDFCIALKWWLT